MPESNPTGTWTAAAEVVLLVIVFFVYAGDRAPMVNEAHYLVKAKNFWQPEWCAGDLFAASGKAHTTFYVLFGWLTRVASLATTAWVGRLVGWTMLAVGLQRLSWRLLPYRYGSLAVATIWIAGIEYGNLAGEWVVGGIEAKVPAYGFVLMGLAELVDRRWHRVWPLLGLASAFHVLSGGWSVIAAMLVWWTTERKRDDRQALISPALLLGGAISLCGLVPAIRLTMGVSPADSTFAAHVYSYIRITHHLLPANLQPAWYLRHAILIVATLAMFRQFPATPDNDKWRRIGWFTVGAVMIAAAGLAIGVLPAYAPDLAAKLLRYYWFRLTDAVVPLAFALAAMRLVVQDVFTWQRAMAVLLLITAIVLVGNSSFRRGKLGVPPSASSHLLGWQTSATAAEQQQAFRDWLAVCNWARGATPADEIFLTPRHQQTFKWYAHRAEVVNWKDVPQDAASLKEWFHRFEDVFPARLGTVRVTIRYADLRRYRTQYGARFMIVDRRITGPNLPLVQLYPIAGEANKTYAVYELPREN
jgi:hypothetical protein